MKKKLAKPVRQLCIIMFLVVATMSAAPALAAVQCYDCHGSKASGDYRPVDSAYRNVTTGGFQGNHRTHMKGPGSPSSCVPCHPGSDQYTTGHRDGLIKVARNINSSPLVTTYRNSTSAFPQTAQPQLGTCSSVNCHFEAATPAWGSAPFASSSDCGRCHGAPPADGTHGVHDSKYGGGSASCGKCHSDHATESAPFAHATSAGKRGLVLRGFTYSKPENTQYPNYLPSQTPARDRNGSCQNFYCHSDGKGAAPNVTPVWGGSFPNDCTGCHGGNASSSRPLATGNHGAHIASRPCGSCHSDTVAEGNDRAVTGQASHADGAKTVHFSGGGSYTAGSKTCNNVQCHGNGTGQIVWGSTSCIGCHSVAQGGRAPVGAQFGANSHHIQGAVTDDKCYQCHWEANSDGTINTLYHGGSASPGASVNLVVYGAGSRPATYTTSDFIGGISNSGGGTWTKAAPITINNSTNSAPLTYYQVKMNVPFAAGMKSDFSDLRFTDGVNELSHWIESYSLSASAVVWVKVPLVAAFSTKTVTMYYGNPAALSSSSIGATFVPNAIAATEGACSDLTNCGSMDSHAEANAVRAYPATIGTRTVSSIYWGSMYDGSSPGSAVRDNFYSRYRFLFIPDVSGTWSFAVDSDDGSELILNPNDRAIPSGETVIASWYGGHAWSNGQTYSGTLTVTANQQYWLDYLQTEWAGGEAAVVWVKKPGESTWKNLTAQNFPNMMFSRKYAAVEPTFSIGATQSVSVSSATATAVTYTANNSRGEIQKLNYHCLGCHSDQNNTSQPFGDGKTPKQYAWDGSSVAARYSQTETTPWGKYSDGNTSPKAAQTKAFSAHGNAMQNQGGWDTNETWSDTRSGIANVACYDCHNSHGSSASGKTTSYTSATPSGGLLKDTTANQGGYGQTYKPAAGGSAATKNAFATGAGLCFDCHQNATAGTTPWGYTDTYGATQKIIGYWDTDYFGPGTFGSQSRFPYKSGTGHQGGHFGASTTLASSPEHQIGGLCTPCHDPHGVSPSLGADKQYAVPLLKGTWVTSPYKEDTAPASNAAGTGPLEGLPYHIDQNTFTAGGVSQTDSQFAGLCLSCHTKSSLTNGTNHAWKSKDRIHEAVKGWKTANGTIQHNYTCSKCHSPHNARLPRLMVTNCLNSMHKGRTGLNTSPVLSGEGYGEETYCDSSIGACYDFGAWDIGSGSGSGRFPGNYSGTVVGSNAITCHENNSGDQSWNTVTTWANVQPPPGPTLVPQSSPITATGTTANITFQWSAVACPSGSQTQYQVQVSGTSSFPSVDYQSAWQAGTSWTQALPAGTWYWRVQARDSVYTSSSSLSGTGTFTISIPTLPASTLTPQGTSHTIGVTPASVTFGWSAVTSSDGDPAQYQVQVSAASSFTSIAYQSNWQSATSWTQALPVGTWYWRVIARDSIHTAGMSTSASNSFAVVDRTPAAPTPTHVANVTNSLTATIAFGWNSVTIPDGDAAQYLVEVSASSGFGTIAYSSGWQSGTGWSQDLPKGTWYWRVTARDGGHTTAASAPSATDSFTIVPPAPASPTPTVQGTSYVIGSGSTASVAFQWGAVSTADGDTAQYLVEVSTVSNFGTIAYQSGWQTGTSWTQTLGVRTWYWRVTARDSVHTLAVSAPSAAGSFAVTDRTPAQAVLTAQPTSYVIASTASIAFAWGGVTAPDGDGVQYLVDVSSVSNFSTIAYNSGWQTGTGWTQALPAGTWYWRVKTRDATHTTAISTSASSSFSVVDRTPAVPTLIDNTGANTNGATITMRWNAVPSKDGDPVQYWVDVSLASDFSSITYSTPAWQTGTSWSQTIPVGTYYWRVRARDSVHTSAVSTYSASDAFTVMVSTSQTWTTPGTYTYTVPAGVNLITVTLAGGGGGAGDYDYYDSYWDGNSGDLVTGTMAVTPGTQYTVVVAGGGSSSSNCGGAYAGSGSGGSGDGPGASGVDYSYDYGYYSGGGGGRSTLRLAGVLKAASAGGQGGYNEGWDDGGVGGGPTDTSGLTGATVSQAGNGGDGTWSVNCGGGGNGFVSITYADRTPTAPVLIPQTTNYGTGATPASVALTWNPAIEPDGDPVQYQVAVSSSASFATIAYQSGWQSGTSWTQTVPLGTWYWRVTARDGVHTTEVSTSASNSFAVVDRTPAAPVLTHVATVTNSLTATIAFGWNSVAMPDGDAAQYLVEVSASSGFGTIAYSSGWQNGTSWSQDLPKGTWYWRVTARDGGHTTAASAASATDSFIIVPPAPVSPTPTAQGTSYVIGSASTASVAFQWGAVSAADGDTAQYLVEVSTVSNFGTIAYQSGWQTGTSWTQPLGVRTWYWRVTARDSVHTLAVSAPSAAGSFAVTDRTPAQAVLTAQPTSYVIASTASIAFAWSTVAAPDGDGVQYLAEVSSSSGFGTIAYTSGWQSGTGWTQALPAGTWYWRVKTRDATHTTAVSTSASNSFAVVDRTPAVPALIDNTGAPTNGATITMQWNAVPSKDGDPVQYWVDVSLASDFSTITYSTPAWQSGTSWSQTVPVGTYYWRVRARDSVHTTAVSTYSASDAFTVMVSTSQTWTTPGTYTYTVPAGVNLVTMTLAGGGGGAGDWDYYESYYDGNSGDLVTGTMAVTPGMQFSVVVAGGGSSSSSCGGAYAGIGSGGSGDGPGASGVDYSYDTGYFSGGGGGRSTIRLAGVLKAASAGGQGGYNEGWDAGGAGGGPTDTSGLTGATVSPAGNGGDGTWSINCGGGGSGFVTIMYADRAPVTPTLTPEETNYTIGTTPASVSLAWNATNAPDGDAVQYLAEVSATSGFGTIAYTSGWQSATGWTQALPVGTWYWRVKARDGVHATEMSTSASNSFAVVDRTPAAPTPTHVANVTNSLTATIAFGWSSVTLPDGDAAQYLVEVSSASNFGTIAYTSGWQSGTGWNQVLPKGTWYWRVTARDSGHTAAVSAASATDSFTIVPPVPASPTLTAQGTSYVIGSSSTASVAFQWGAVTNADGDTAQYLVEVSTVSNFGTIAYQSGWQTGTSWTQALGVRTWYWRVTARDSVHIMAVSAPSAGSSFAVTDRTPAQAVLTAQPTSYIIGGTASIAFAWGAVTAPDGDGVQYLAEVSASSGFGTIAYNSGWQSGTGWTQALPAGTWYWRVKTRDATHTTAISTSASSSFAVVDRTPAVPTLVDRTDVQPAGSTTDVTVTWNAVMSRDTDPVQYQVDVSSSATFATIDYQSAWQTTTGWTQALPKGTWYWRVRARDGVHTTAVSGYSTVDTFRIALLVSWSSPGTYSWTVPAGVTSVSVTVAGGGGGAGDWDYYESYYDGNSGELVTGTMTVSPGTEYTVVVAGGGSSSSNCGGAYAGNGSGGSGDGPGADGVDYSYDYGYYSGGGGGRSTIRLAGVLKAAAAGGQGGYNEGWDQGGAGGGPTDTSSLTGASVSQAGNGGDGSWNLNCGGGGSGSVMITYGF